ncbi:hypothetical protein WN55_10504 [Dufourea novaeangliae]|uniref:Uncharacterized protein n=1 Tax=Dufourea novaeangliae TaxID=178035 RepID=A0A154P429_DUFNO|nr:hypothetical protein WN55_10504 [Dufourea novaeangliae]
MTVLTIIVCKFLQNVFPLHVLYSLSEQRGRKSVLTTLSPASYVMSEQLAHDLLIIALLRGELLKKKKKKKS